MKTKKKNLFAKIFSIFMICCFAFLCVGCLGSSPDDYGDESSPGSAFEDMAFDMYGTKVLYRPDSYDYDYGSGAESGQTNNYYGKYAWQILNGLYYTYGIADNQTLTNYLPSFSETGTLSEKRAYLYDSIRYKVDSVGTVNKQVTVDSSGNRSDPTDISLMIVGANTNLNWNWSFDYDLSSYDASMNALLANSEFSYVNGNKLYNTAYDNLQQLNEAINNTYIPAYQTNYQSIYLGSESANDEENYSEYVKALQYVIYCYALDLEPAQVTVTINDNVSAEKNQYYNVQVGTYVAKDGKSSADLAVEDITALFKKIGSYVGLIDRQIAKISKWVKENVIGLDKIQNDSFTVYSDVTQVIDSDGTTSYEFNETNSTTSALGRDYDRVVDEIVDASCEKVSIGKDGDQDVTIDNRFLASEVKEYAGNTFFIAGDENFPKYEEGQHPVAIQPLEYQSVQFMLKESVQIDEIWLALKYDADLDGTEEGVWNPNKYIDIIVELNYFSHANKKLYTVGTQQTRIYDGPYELSGDYPEGFPDDHGTLFFDSFGQNCKDEELKTLLVNDGLPVGKFNTDIGNGVLKTDVGLSGYSGIPLVSKNPLVLVGTTNARKYYSILEPKDDEITVENSTYITGRFNEEMFKGSDGCDYLEVTYKVLKAKADSTTNYKFYTGIAFLSDTGL